jgi:hypothetical protein
MPSQWQNFLRNRGEWHGSFVTLSRAGVIEADTPSILSLESDEDDRLVRFWLRRYGPEGRRGVPVSETKQDYRSLGRQVVFFETGAFSKGSMQLAPHTPFGAEYGFVLQDRRHRLVQLYSEAGEAGQLVLIREFRAGSAASERPPLSPEQLLGQWQGQSATVTADWPEPERAECTVRFEPEDLEACQFLPDGGYSRRPDRVGHRAAFQVEVGWLGAPERLERLIRCYDASGAWHSARHEILTPC